MFIEIKATPVALARWAAFRCQDPAGVLPPVAELAKRGLVAIHDGDSRFAQRSITLRAEAPAPAIVPTEWETLWILVPAGDIIDATWTSGSGRSQGIYDAKEGVLEVRTTSSWPIYALSAADVGDNLRVVLWDESERELLQSIAGVEGGPAWAQAAARKMLAVATVSAET